MAEKTVRFNFQRNRWQELAALVEDGLRRRIFPGLELLVARGEEVLIHEAWGRLEIGPDAAALETGTLWDVASLTKPLATATCLMVLLEQGALALEERGAQFFPELDTPEKNGITLRHLLTHTAGLPAWADLYSQTSTPGEALQRLLHLPLSHPTGTAVLYSDLGYLLLGEIVRRVTDSSLAEVFHRQVAHPLGLAHTGFNPPAEGWGRPIAPTQYCPFRERLLRGTVHDENCFRFRGEGGNAGLFSTAADLHRLARLFLEGGAVEGARVLTPRTVRLMTENQNPERLPPRGLGWDIKGTGFGYASCGDLVRPGAFGHTGFTGTSLWIEPAGGLTVIVLSNRVNIARNKNQPDMIRFRPRLHNLVVGLTES